jgi:hypothetical protein
LDLILRGASTAELVDAAFDDDLMSVENGSELTRSWSTVLVCVDLDDQELSNCAVEVTDFEGNLVGSSTTDSTGFNEGLALVEYVQSGGTRTAFTPHEITVTFGAWDTTFVHQANGREVIEVVIPRGATDVDDPSELPREFALYPNAPNPIRTTSTITFALPVESRVVMNLYDVSGRVVRRLLDHRRPAGFHSVPLDRGSLSSGVYFYRMEAGSYRQTRKMMILE